MTLEISLSERDLDRAIGLVELYKKDLEGKTSVFVDHVAKTVEDNARNELSKHIWSGETIASLHTEKMAARGHTHNRKVSVGGAAIWLEFGTGVVANNCFPGAFIHPLAQELGMNGIGTYGAGHGSDPRGWYFDEGVWDNGTFTSWQTYHTFGIPATMFMYNSAKIARANIPRLAREVFWTK